MEKNKWWQGPLRVMQYNLQVRDTPGMDARTIARQTRELGCNAVVMNVGGIYAWYPTQVPFHHRNEFLPQGRDLLQELIDAFHELEIRFVARFDFSMTEDTTYLQRPDWFARHKDKSPYFRGDKRMGEWSLLMTTCATGGYRNEEVAVPVLREVLGKYAIDGIFLNAPMAFPCFCERCQAKYREKYGEEMPDTEMELREDWLTGLQKENIGNLYRAIKEEKPQIPLILYYVPYSLGKKDYSKFRIDRDSIYDRYATADLICTESQDTLSLGADSLPWHMSPTMAMKAGQRPDETKRPFGIIHSCPGMDWRHVGLPVEEYVPWMAQVPAAGGVLWHSVTGYPDSILDKRVLRAVDTVDHMIIRTEEEMTGARSHADALLCWDGSLLSRSMAQALSCLHLGYDLMQDYDIDKERMKRYPLVLVPDGLLENEELSLALREYVAGGGRAIVETTDPRALSREHSLFGIRPQVDLGEYLKASYYRFEEAGACIHTGMEETDKIVFRGEVNYCFPDGGEVLATLVPPFAPADAAGAPPERASLPVAFTRIPLTVRHQYGTGEVVLLPFSLSDLLMQFRMPDHYRLLENLTRLFLPERRVELSAPAQVVMNAYHKENRILVHLVNMTGARPMGETLEVRDVCLMLRLPEGKKAKLVRCPIEEESVQWKEENGRVEITLSRLRVWEMITLELE